MFPKLFAAALLGLGLLLCAPGCQTKEPVLWSSAHMKRHGMTIVDGSRDLVSEVERIVFDMEEVPDETVAEHFGRIGQTFTYGFHRIHMNVDRIIFDMPEYPLEVEE